MASTRKPSSNELAARVAAALAPFVAPGAHAVLGLSGGVDSVVLLSLLRELAQEMGFSLRAVHVDHGISPHSPRWAEFCERLCRESGVPLQVAKIDVPHDGELGLEGEARRARYEVFAGLEADVLVLAQHRDDQAETLLLQLLRGSGLRGMAAMPRERSLVGARVRMLRPLLDTSREEIEAYARERGLSWVEDESNADTVRRRNFLRREVLPLLERQFPAAREIVARGAGHLAESVGLVDALARLDREHAGGEAIVLPRLLELGEGRAKNVLRHLCEERGVAAPSAAKLGELLRQLASARQDAGVSVPVSGWSFRRYRDRLYLEPLRGVPESEMRELWNGESSLPLLTLGGVLRFKPEEGRGLSVARLRSAPVTVQLRKGGERFQPNCRRPRRTLKNLLQERGVPPWRRERLPLVYCGDRLVSVPGVGDECEYQAASGEAGLIVSWEPLE